MGNYRIPITTNFYYIKTTLQSTNTYEMNTTKVSNPETGLSWTTAATDAERLDGKADGKGIRMTTGTDGTVFQCVYVRVPANLCYMGLQFKTEYVTDGTMGTYAYIYNWTRGRWDDHGMTPSGTQQQYNGATIDKKDVTSPNGYVYYAFTQHDTATTAQTIMIDSVVQIPYYCTPTGLRVESTTGLTRGTSDAAPGTGKAKFVWDAESYASGYYFYIFDGNTYQKIEVDNWWNWFDTGYLDLAPTPSELNAIADNSATSVLKLPTGYMDGFGIKRSTSSTTDSTSYTVNVSLPKNTEYEIVAFLKRSGDYGTDMSPFYIELYSAGWDNTATQIVASPDQLVNDANSDWNQESFYTKYTKKFNTGDIPTTVAIRGRTYQANCYMQASNIYVKPVGAPLPDRASFIYKKTVGEAYDDLPGYYVRISVYKSGSPIQETPLSDPVYVTFPLMTDQRVASLRKDALQIQGEIIEGISPPVANGLVAYHPFRTSYHNKLTGNLPLQPTLPYVNLMGVQTLDWRDPNNWDKVYLNGALSGTLSWSKEEECLVADGHGWWALKSYIPINTGLNYYIEATMRQNTVTSQTMYLGDISYDINKNMTPQHPGSYEYFGATGVTVPTSWTTYKNTQLGGAARIGTSTDGNQGTFDPNCAYVRPMFIANYSGGVKDTDILKIKDIKFYYTDTDTSGTNIDETGMRMMGASNNLVGNNAFWANNGATATVVTLPDAPVPSAQTWELKKTGTASQWTGMQPPITGTFNNLDTFTLSFWYKSSTPIDVTAFSYTFYRNDWTGPCATSTSAPIVYDGKWHYVKMTVNFTETVTDPRIADGPSWNYSSQAGTMYINGVQWEKKQYASTYGNTYNGNLSLPVSLGSSTWTVMFSGENPMLYDQIDKGWFAVRSFDSQKYINFFFGWGNDTYIGDWTNRTHYQGPGISYSRNDTLVHVFQRTSSTNYRWRIYINGVVAHDYTVSDPNYNFNSDVMPIGCCTGNEAGIPSHAKIKDLMIYNRAISDTEITQLLGMDSLPHKMRFSSKGDLIVKSIKENPAFIPSDAYHIPLLGSTMDKGGLIKPVTSGVIYERDGAWVGTQKTNVVMNTDLNYGWTQGYNTNIQWDEIPPPPNVYSPVVGFEDARDADTEGNAFWYCYGDYAPQTSSTTYTISLWVKTQATINIRAYTADNSEAGRITTEFITVKPSDGWKRVVWNPITTIANNDSKSLSFYWEGLKYGRKMWLCAPQMEIGTHASPFIPSATQGSIVGTRNAGQLQFNLNRDLGLDWNGDWSIVYWKKPISTHNNLLTGYSIDSLGSNSNSVGGGYVWWGKLDSADYLSGFSTMTSTSFPNGQTFTSAQYFNRWHMVSVIKSGTTLTHKYYGINNTTSTNTITMGTISSNYFITQYGYDLMLGGWDNNNACNSYYRDLVVAKRAFTDAELAAINKNAVIRNFRDYSQFMNVKEGAKL